jgi:hypothetical protein
MASRTVPISPRQIDPLSWITGPLVPLAFAGVSIAYAVYGIVTTAAFASPVLQVSASVLFVVAQLVLHFAARGLRGVVPTRIAVGAVALGCGALMLSAVGYADHGFAVELWWAPLALSLTMGSLAPYLPAGRIAVITSIATAAVVPPSVALIAPHIERWGPASVTVIIALPLVCGIVLASLFSAYIVRRMQALLEARSQNVIVARDDDEGSETDERARLAHLTARAVPFLERIADTGVIGAADRALAGQLARRLRDDLVTQASASWLDRLEAGSRLVVIDPDERADSLRPSQRTALRGLIRALLSAKGAASLLVELRGRPDGATAVGVSMDAELPEGRRMMYLAPYILTLQMTADDLVWENDEVLQVTFEFPRDQKSLGDG